MPSTPAEHGSRSFAIVVIETCETEFFTAFPEVADALTVDAKGGWE